MTENATATELNCQHPTANVDKEASIKNVLDFTNEFAKLREANSLVMKALPIGVIRDQTTKPTKKFSGVSICYQLRCVVDGSYFVR
jgi:hypothetical protein